MKIVAICDNCGARLEVEIETADIMEAAIEALGKLTHEPNCPRITNETK